MEEDFVLNEKNIIEALKDKKITVEQAEILLKKLKEKKAFIQYSDSDIAVIGMAGRYPKANNITQYWNVIENGEDCIVTIPKSRWDMGKYYDPEIGKEGKIYCNHIGMVDDVECFDPLFFEITPSEAETMEPLHRIFIEEGYKAFEDAGYSRSALNGMNCGIYAGMVAGDYECMNEGHGAKSALTGSSNAIAVARLAYYLNLKGPAIAIDTACSSSMVCTNLAVQALNKGEIDMALVGGSSVYISPEGYSAMCSAGMLSPDGRCKTFDDSANGFVPAEGAGALVLKRLKDAIRDQDNIYGVIIASGMNQDGKTNGITAPSLNRQIDLVNDTYKRYNINPETISYAELHGTGTNLGDPIELEALATAFLGQTEKKNYCAIGSVKSNLGHISAVSGIAGIEKVLLCMQNKELVPTLHVKKPNEKFDFDNSPFYINTEKKDWVGGQSPRRACVSSFGFSGTNTHVVVQEYVRPKIERMDRISATRKGFFLLTASTKALLKEYAKNMYEFLQKNPSLNLTDVLYTLQVGREPLKQRLAIIVENMNDLIQKLGRYLDHGADDKHIFEATVKKTKNILLMNHEVLNLTGLSTQSIIDNYFANKKMDWETFYECKEERRRISLPNTPMEREIFWFNKDNTAKTDVIEASEQNSLPLLRNRTISSYRSTLSIVYDGQEFFLNEHKILGEKVLPGAAVLEMAREAGELVSEEKVTGLKDVIWLQPIVINDENNQVEIHVQSDENNEILFEVTNCEIVCAQGKLLYGDPTQSNERFDCKMIANQLPTVDFSLLYEKNTDSISYGNHFKVIQTMNANETETMASLGVKGESIDIEKELRMYPLHPGFLDGAFQTIFPFVKPTGVSYLPFSVGSINVLGALTEKMYVYTTKNEVKSEGMLSVNLNILDEKGTVLVKIEEFQARAFQKSNHIRRAYQPYSLTQKWCESKVIKKRTENLALTFVLEDDVKLEHKKVFEGLRNAIKERDKEVCFVSAEDFVQTVCDKASNYQKDVRVLLYCTYGIENIIKILKGLMTLKGLEMVYVENVYNTDDEEGSIYDQALSSLFKTLAIEKNSIKFKNIGLSFGDESISQLCTTMVDELEGEFEEVDIIYRLGKRFTRKVCQTQKDSEYNSNLVVKDTGIYLITGGASGVGMILADHIAKQCHATIILLGRTAENNSIQEKVKVLNSNKGMVVYKQCDVSKKEQVTKLVHTVKKEYGEITGVIHGAGIVSDCLFINKSIKDFKDVLDPKIEGIKNLDEVLNNETLDFFVACSSFSSIIGNIGQSDYCFANGLMDHYMEYRNKLQKKGARFGKSVTINWPYWANGGMRITDEAVKRLEEGYGIVPLSDEAGCTCFDEALTYDGSQLIYTIGNERKINKVFGVEGAKEQEITNKSSNENIDYEVTKEAFSDFVMTYLKNVFAEIVRIKIEKIDETEYLDVYGLDSIVIMSLTRRLEKDFGELPKTIFFEYETLEEVADYFEKNYEETLYQLLTGTDKTSTVPTLVTKDEAIKVTMPENTESESGDIAIIGIDGRYPQADSLGAFWDNLKKGKDSITEIPRNRWNHNRYFREERNLTGSAYSKWGGFLDDIDKFDPLFFSITPGEADFLDPQVRIFLENVWNTVEDAGYTREALSKSRVGVFVGVMYSMYELYQGKLKGKRVPVSSSFSAIANRVSYFMNFHGPSIAIDTMCSSSLTSLHLACEDIRHGECEMAVAGGINLSLHPNKYLLLSQGNFASTDGRCRAFGEGGDGYVPGEGVGSVLLKPLKKAIEDKDYIYAVIKGSAINSGGKTNGFTVPSPVAQADVIKQALKKAKVKPEQISYIEAHGTGTSLGDPIEINGLSKIFQGEDKGYQFCSIGSVKSNVGHLESAAGIVALSKVVLQLKNKKLVPSLHSDVLNPNIKFEKSPFKVQHVLEDWKQAKTDLIKQPLCAGISAFGAGGSNAHVVIEEFINNTVESNNTKQERIYVFSAKDKERLKEKIATFSRFLKGELLYHIDDYKEPERISLNEEAIAYTLQSGREEMEERLAVVCSGIESLVQKLEHYLSGKLKEDMYTANIMDVKEDTEFYRTILQSQKDVPSFISDGDLHQLAYLWSNGVKMQWELLYGKNKPYKIPLPGYPFAKEHHWVLTVDEMESTIPKQLASTERLSTLLCKNMSTLNEMKYSIMLTGHEFFMRDHVVKERNVLPGAVYLEIVTEAAEQAYGHENPRLKIKNAIWLRPFIMECNQERKLFITLKEIKDEWLKFQIFETDQEGQDILYCEGIVKEVEEEVTDKLNIEDMKAHLEKGHAKEQIYELFDQIGISYGESMRSINQAYYSDNAALVEIEVPVNEQNIEFTLHPSILDGAFQSNFCWGEDRIETEYETRLPFLFDQMYIGAPTENHMYVYIRKDVNETRENILQKMNIDLCDEQGHVNVSLRKMLFKGNNINKIHEDQKLLFTTERSKDDSIEEGMYQYSKKIAILCNLTKQEEDKMECSKYDEIIILNVEGTTIEKQYISYSVQLLGIIQKLFSKKHKGMVLVRLFINISGESVKLKGLLGFLKTVTAENFKVVCQLVMQDENGIRYKETIKTVTLSEDKKVENTWSNQGSYLIVGGAGKLGMLVASDIIANTKDSKVILTGRRELSQQIEDRMNSITTDHNRILYEKMDAQDKLEVERLVQALKVRNEEVIGVVYCAGVLHDSFILNKKLDDFTQVLSTKIVGIENIDAAFANVQLQSFIIFSSIASLIGNVGQADYACANGYLDCFAEYRNRLVDCNERYGKTISINWPYWEQGGMRINEDNVKLAKEQSGLRPLTNESGIQLLHMVLATSYAQVVPVEGNKKRIYNMLLNKQDEGRTEVNNKKDQDVVLDEKSIKKQLLERLKQILADETKLEVSRIDERRALEDYGIDSVMILHLTHELEKDYETLPKTLFFDNQNLRQLTQYLYEEFNEKTRKIFKVEHESITKTETIQMKRPLAMKSGTINDHSDDALHTEFAIIGLSGKYPKSDNIEMYWENLKSGTDCVSEVPQNRWNQDAYYDSDKSTPNKTYAKWGGFIDGVENFDPKFFKVSPAEATIMDPQERMFLECVYHAIEDAGYTTEHLSADDNKVGVYVGVMNDEYQLYGAQAQTNGINVALNGCAASVANRVSYHYGFHGPSMAVDTMCSSSLVCVHLACNSIKNGDCDVAIAGGVNLIVHPNKYIMLGNGRFASSVGRCQTFGQGGDGYTPGEGIGAMIIKEKSRAIADGDHIYGIIKGSAVNHGGKTNGFTVPNTIYQEQVIATALERADVNPEQISFLEAHGTGTALGDPIEITALTRAYQRKTSKTGYCKIGSAKSMIGHCESAAGIAGVTKVLLQMKHKKVVPTIHSKELNPDIDFKNSPFVVAHEYEEWERPMKEEQGVKRELPRIAGVSAFGAGGTNAHVILEEYIDEVPTSSTSQSSYIVPLSAASQQQLETQIQNLNNWLEHNVNASLEQIAYTLQTGRAAMKERAAFIVSSMDDLKQKVKEYQKQREGSLRGSLKADSIIRNMFDEDEEIQEYVKKWSNEGSIKKIAELWIEGLDFDWRVLYQDKIIRKLSLPVYPFEEKHCWISKEYINIDNIGLEFISETIHPFLHKNTSNSTANQYETTYKDTDKILMDHVIGSNKTLPAVAYLEMVSAAYINANKIETEEEKRICIEDAMFNKPAIPNAGRLHLVTRLAKIDRGMRAIITSNSLKDKEQYFEAEITKLNEVTDETVDVEILKTHNASEIIDGIFIYDSFEKLGIKYGTGQRGIAYLIPGVEEAVSRIILPEELKTEFPKFLLHPCILDSALQTALGLTMNCDTELNDLEIPYMVGKVKVYKRCTDKMWAIVKKVKDQIKDIALYDDAGCLCIKLEHVIYRRIITKSENINEMKEQKSAGEMSVNEMYEKTADYLKDIFSRVLNMQTEEIQAEVLFEEYGVDSIMIMNISEMIEKDLGKISKTLLFEYQNLDTLTQYFAEEYKEKLEHMFGHEIDIKEEQKALGLVEGSFSETKNVSVSNEKKSIEVAVIGISGRYAQADNIVEYWNHILNGDDCITEIPKERWEFQTYYDEDKTKVGKSYSKWGGFLNDVDCFDSRFFHMTPRDAVIMDPQERLFMECAYHAMEDGGYTRQSLGYKPGSEVRRNVGVFVGVMNEEYHFYAIEEQAKKNPVVVADNISHVANRFSYFCDFHGPSIALDTMCSSSSVAIHWAVNSIKNGECDVAIAGGVNAILHPNKYLVLSSGKFASEDGRCRSFGKGGTGYVPGEGVGAVLLKEKNQAIKDGDHIYGIIKGTSVNHGGKTNGYTVPNLLAQKEVIESALRNANITPNQISYIEAHGTGTALGDPIEINALDKVFKAYNVDKNNCAVGSVKSNIGHCESASGIAAFTKVLLQMEHGIIAPSLHSDVLNPNIDFEGSCFYVQQEAKEWKRKKVYRNNTEVEENRIAGISSFGAGGTNAHIVVEEYNALHKTYKNQNRQTIIILSALKEDILCTIAKRLYERIATATDKNLHELAYTLMVGREALEERVAFVASNIEEVREKLQCIVKHQVSRELYYGHTYGKKKNVSNEQKNRAIEEQNFELLCKMWTEGNDVDLAKIYKNERPNKMSLPGYPFAKEHHFIKKAVLSQGVLIGGERVINQSSLYSQKYTVAYTNRDVSMHQNIVSAAMILEDIRNAVSQSLELPVFIMKNIVFSKPLVLSETKKRVAINISPNDSELKFKMQVDKNDVVENICEGVVLCDAKEDYDIQETILDLESLQSGQYKTITGSDGYESIRVYNEYSLGYIKEHAKQGSNKAILNPTVLDGAFQCVGDLISERNNNDDSVYIPFGMGEIRIYDSLKENVIVCITEVTDANGNKDEVVKFDLVLIDESGNILVEIDKFSLKSYTDVPRKEIEETKETKETMKYFVTEWVQSPPVTSPSIMDKNELLTIILGGMEGEGFFEEYKHVCKTQQQSGKTLFLKTSEEFNVKHGDLSQYINMLKQIETESFKDIRVVMYRTKSDYEKEQEALTEIYHLFYISKAFMQIKNKSNVRLEVIFSTKEGEIYPEYSALAGFAKSLEMENPFYQYRIIKIMETGEKDMHKEAMIALKEFSVVDEGCYEVKYQQGIRYVPQLMPVLAEEVVIFRPAENKCYVITGGVGYLSMVFAEFFAKQKGCKLVLTGRRVLNEMEQKKIDALKKYGAQVIYVSADIATEEGARKVYETAKKEFGSIHVIIHSAGVIKDTFLLKKTEDDMKSVFAPKIYGTKYMDEYFKEECLDYFIVFSSIAGVWGNVGQTDYSYANSFMNHFVQWRNEQAENGKRFGRAISLNWPLWDNGMHVEQSIKDMMKKQAGFVPIKEEEGILAFKKSISMEQNQIVIIKQV